MQPHHPNYSLKYNIIKSKIKPSKQLLLLHGYGSSGDNMLNIIEQLGDYIPNVNFIAPNAPNPYENNYYSDYGYVGYQWFSLADRNPHNMLSGAQESSKYVIKLIENLVQNEPHLPLYVLGFSQGAMVAAHSVMRSKNKVAGLIMCSGALIAPDILEKEIHAEARQCSILITHGDADSVVDHKMSIIAHETFKKIGLKSKLVIEEDIDHMIGMKAMDEIRQMLSFF